MISPQTRARPNQTSNHNRIKILQLQSHSILTFFLKLTNLKKTPGKPIIFCCQHFSFFKDDIDALSGICRKYLFSLRQARC